MKTLEHNLKVALISHEYPPFFFGGIGSYCHDLAVNLAKKGISPTVFAGGPSETVRECDNSVEVIRLPYSDFPPRPMWFQLQNLRTISNHLSEFDIIHIANPTSGGVFAYVAKRMKKPVVTTLHSVPPLHSLKHMLHCPLSDLSLGDILLEFFEYQLRTFTTKLSIVNSNHVISCGLYALDEAKIYFNLDMRNASIIHNGISFDQIQNTSVPPEDSNSKDFISILYVGRLYCLKGMTYLMKALGLLKQRFTDFRVDVFGSGPLEGKIRKQRSHLGLENNVYLRGFTADRMNLTERIKSADIVALPSLSEVGPSISVLEAMAYRKAVVAFDLPFSRELIHNFKNGLLAKPQNTEDLADKLYLLCSDTNLRTRLGLNAYAYVREKHDWSRLVDGYCRIYNDLLS